MRSRHTIRNMLLFWVGEKLWKRHQSKNVRPSASSQPYQQTKSKMR